MLRCILTHLPLVMCIITAFTAGSVNKKEDKNPIDYYGMSILICTSCAWGIAYRHRALDGIS